MGKNPPLKKVTVVKEVPEEVIGSNVVSVKENHTIQYEFSQDELKEKSKALANAIKDKARLVDEKKAVMSSFKYKQDGIDAMINSLSSDIQSGFEMKHVTCEVNKDFDKGIKEYRYEGKLYETTMLSAADHQLRLDDMADAAIEEEQELQEDDVFEEDSVDDEA